MTQDYGCVLRGGRRRRLQSYDIAFRRSTTQLYSQGSELRENTHAPWYKPVTSRFESDVSEPLVVSVPGLGYSAMLNFARDQRLQLVVLGGAEAG